MIEFYEVEPGIFVSKCGRVSKEAKYTERGNTKVRYRAVQLKGKRVDVHRLVAEHFIPNPECKPWVLHYDDNQQNNHVSNLRWGTPKDNQKDAFRNGKFKGRLLKLKAHRSRIHKWILEEMKQGVRNKDIAKKYGISPGRVSQIMKILAKEMP